MLAVSYHLLFGLMLACLLTHHCHAESVMYERYLQHGKKGSFEPLEMSLGGKKGRQGGKKGMSMSFLAPSTSTAPSGTPSISVAPSSTPSISVAPSSTPSISVAPSSTPSTSAAPTTLCSGLVDVVILVNGVEADEFEVPPAMDAPTDCPFTLSYSYRVTNNSNEFSYAVGFTVFSGVPVASGIEERQLITLFPGESFVDDVTSETRDRCVGFAIDLTVAVEGTFANDLFCREEAGPIRVSTNM